MITEEGYEGDAEGNSSCNSSLGDLERPIYQVPEKLIVRIRQEHDLHFGYSRGSKSKEDIKAVVDATILRLLFRIRVGAALVSCTSS